jgi:hypothetical protein
LTVEIDHPEHIARRVAELSATMTRLAEVLQAAERIVAEVCRELRRLGLAERLGEEFGDVRRAGTAAERVQDELDRLAGELHLGTIGRPPVRPSGTRDPIDRASGRLRDPERISERLMVACPACGRHFESTVASDPEALTAVGIDGRTYRCPHCGEMQTYETWDHFLE